MNSNDWVIRNERGEYLAITKHGAFHWSAKVDATIGDTDAGTGDSVHTLHFRDEASARAVTLIDDAVVQQHRSVEGL